VRNSLNIKVGTGPCCTVHKAQRCAVVRIISGIASLTIISNSILGPVDISTNIMQDERAWCGMSCAVSTLGLV
jgi:hypothetical protein